MRTLFLVLLLANVLLFAAQFEVVRNLVLEARPAQPAPLNAERLRIIRDTSAGPRTPANPQPAAAAPG